MVLLVAAGGLRAQTVSTDKTSLSFSGLVGGAQVQQSLTITSSPGSVTFVISSNQSWLKVSPQIGTTPSAVTVTADPTGLAAGPYYATLSVIGLPSGGASVQVSFTVSTIYADPLSLQFSYTIGSGAVPGVQSITLSGPSTTFTAAASTNPPGGNWLQVVPTSGTSPGAVTARLNPTIVPGLSAGTYSGAITITPTSGSSTTPVMVAVTLTVTPAPPVTVNPASLVFNFQTGQTPPSAQTMTISATPGQLVNFAIYNTYEGNPGKAWITLNPSSGAIPTSGSTQVTVGVDTTNLQPNTYTARMTLVAAGVAQPDIPVKLLISNLQLLNVPSAALTFTYQLNGAVPATQYVTCTATSGTLSFAISASSGASWLSVPATGATPAPFAVTVNPAGLPPGTYSGTITVTGTGAGNGPQQIPVTLKITNDPMIVASATSLAFPYQIAQATPSPQNIKVTSSTGALLVYTASATTSTCGNSWLTLTGTTSGTTSDNFTVWANPTGLSAGTCSGTITITATNASTGAAAINSPVTISVTLYVSNTPLLIAWPLPPFTFSVQQGAQAPAPQTINLNSTSPTEQVNFGVTSSGNWLSVSPISGATPNTAIISVNPAQLLAGIYTGSVTISATGSGGVALPTTVLPVTLQVTTGSLTLSPTALSFTQSKGGSAPPAQTVTVGSTGQPLTYTAVASSAGGWLSVTPVTGTTSSNPTVSVSVDGSNLTPATYVGTITVTGIFAGNSPATVSVTLTVTAGTITAAPSSLTFTQVAGGSAPASQNVIVSGTPGPISFSVTTGTNSGGTWLAATPQSGTTPGTVQVAVGASGLTANTYTGKITITAAGATGSPIDIPVTLNVLAPSTLTATPSTLNFSYTIGLAPPQVLVEVREVVAAELLGGNP